MTDRKMSSLLTAAPETIRVLPTPLYLATSAACLTNDWTDWLGYTVPASYGPIEEELAALHEKAGLIDVSPIGKYVVSGKDVEAFLDHTFVTSLLEAKVGQSFIAPFCHSNGQTINIAEASRLAENYWWITTPGRHLHWLEEAAKGFDVEVRDFSDSYAGLRLIGPAVKDVLKASGLEALKNLPMGGAMHIVLDDMTLIATNSAHEKISGLTLWCSADRGEAFWNAITEAGAPFGLQPVGRSTSEVYRIENGLPAAGAEFVPSPQALHNDRRHSPIALGFGSYVDFDKLVFNGRSALLEEHRNERTLKLVQMSFSGKAPPPGTHIYEPSGLVPLAWRKPIGIVTSSATLPDRMSAPALGLMKPLAANPGQKVVATFHSKEDLVSGTVRIEGRVSRVVHFETP